MNWKKGSLMLLSLEHQLPEPIIQLNPNKAHFKNSQPVAPYISFVNAVAYRQTCNEEGATAYQLALDPIGPKARATSTINNPSELKDLLEEYYEFANVLNKLSSKSLSAQSPSVLGGLELCFGQALARYPAWPQHIHRL